MSLPCIATDHSHHHLANAHRGPSLTRTQSAYVWLQHGKEYWACVNPHQAHACMHLCDQADKNMRSMLSGAAALFGFWLSCHTCMAVASAPATHVRLSMPIVCGHLHWMLVCRCVQALTVRSSWDLAEVDGGRLPSRLHKRHHHPRKGCRECAEGNCCNRGAQTPPEALRVP